MRPILSIVPILMSIASVAIAASGPSPLRPIHLRTAPRSPMAAGAQALDTYHNGVTLRCADCHVMHQSKQHRLNDDPVNDPFGGYPQNFAGGAHLLKTADPIDLCLTCHDNQPGIPDVVGTDINGLAARSAGYFADIGERNPRGHSLERGLKTEDYELCLRCHFGGELATASVTCIDCHNPHGNGRPRNLQWASYPGGEPQFGLLQSGPAAGLARYEEANVAYGTANSDLLREVSNMCLDCHHVYSGESYIDPDGDGWHNRHPSYDSERGSTNSIAQGAARGTTDPSHWEAGSGAGFNGTSRLKWVGINATDFVTATQVQATTNGVFCLSCHQAHGNGHAFALRWDPTTTPDGLGCEQCHNRTEL